MSLHWNQLKREVNPSCNLSIRQQGIYGLHGNEGIFFHFHSTFGYFYSNKTIWISSLVEEVCGIAGDVCILKLTILVDSSYMFDGKYSDTNWIHLMVDPQIFFAQGYYYYYYSYYYYHYTFCYCYYHCYSYYYSYFYYSYCNEDVLARLRSRQIMLLGVILSYILYKYHL